MAFELNMLNTPKLTLRDQVSEVGRRGVGVHCFLEAR